MSYKELSSLPAWRPWIYDGGDDKVIEAEGKPLAWSASFPPPPLEAEIYVSMNKLGWGRVKGYAAVDGFLAVRVLFRDPPAWHVRQNGPGSVGCVFGAEIREVAV